MTRLTKPDPDAVARHYDNAHRRIVDLVGGLTDYQLATQVPATPGWYVHDVLAHLVALPTDALAGRLTGLPTDELTAQQVRDRKGRTVAELVEEWATTVPSMLDGAKAGLVPPNLAVDAVTHEQDMRGALGLERTPDAEALRFSLALYCFGIDRKLRSAGAPPLRLRATDSDYDVVLGAGEGSAEPATTLRATEFELFRALSGRRGRSAIAAMAWHGDAGAHAESLNIFGPVPAHEVSD